MRQLRGEVLNADAYYESVTPVQGGGTQRNIFCSVRCINAEAEFSDEEIEQLMRQHGDEIPPEYEFEWSASVSSGLEGKQFPNRGTEGRFYILWDHLENDYGIEMFHDSTEQLFEIILYTYDYNENGEKIGLENVRKQKTGLMQRAPSTLQSTKG